MWIIKAFIKACSIDSRNEQSPTCEVVLETQESSLQKSPTDFYLAQLARHLTDDLGIVGSNPTGGNFWWIFFLFCVTADLSDNLTEMRQISLSWKTRMSSGWCYYPRPYFESLVFIFIALVTMVRSQRLIPFILLYSFQDCFPWFWWKGNQFFKTEFVTSVEWKLKSYSTANYPKMI